MTVSAETAPIILRRKDVESRTGLSRSTIYELVAQGKFPAPVRLTERCVGWVESEVNDWVTQRIADHRHVGTEY